MIVSFFLEKAGLTTKLTQAASDAIEDQLTNEQIRECFESASPSKARKALIQSIHQQNIAEMEQTADELADEQATMPEEPEDVEAGD